LKKVDCRTCSSPIRPGLVDSFPCLAWPYYPTRHPLCLYQICHQAHCICLDQGRLQPSPDDPREVQTSSWRCWNNCCLPRGHFHPSRICRQHKGKPCSEFVWSACVHWHILCYFPGPQGNSMADCHCRNACSILAGTLCVANKGWCKYSSNIRTSSNPPTEKNSMIFSTSSPTLPRPSSDLPLKEPHSSSALQLWNSDTSFSTSSHQSSSSSHSSNFCTTGAGYNGPSRSSRPCSSTG
jgi:hypothetical protein